MWVHIYDKNRNWSKRVELFAIARGRRAPSTMPVISGKQSCLFILALPIFVPDQVMKPPDWHEANFHMHSVTDIPVKFEFHILR